MKHKKIPVVYFLLAFAGFILLCWGGLWVYTKIRLLMRPEFYDIREKIMFSLIGWMSAAAFGLFLCIYFGRRCIKQMDGLLEKLIEPEEDTDPEQEQPRLHRIGNKLTYLHIVPPSEDAPKKDHTNQN